MTELIDYTVLNNTIARSVQCMEPYAIQMTSAMTADINGYSWGYADALYENGINNLMSCIHTHHGYHPLFKKQTPFYWESPKGNKLLVWNGEHYLIGNELFIAEDDVYEWTIRDGIAQEHLKKFEFAEKRIEAYVSVLREQKHPYDFAPISISGRMSDNSPASAKIIEFVHEYNALHGQEIELKMVTLDEFFDILKQG
ncbi:glycoside hydrolase, partial [Neobacillus drentensis]